MRAIMEYRWLMALVFMVVELLGYSTVQSTALVQVTSHEPMVAFSCGFPAMYMTEEGWKKDDSSDCLLEPQAILMYCRKTYPTLDVRNVVEASSTVRIEDWCSFGRTRCHHRAYTVRPYRCLVGAFQSDALLVPRSCVFDHIHDPRACLTYDAWNYSADAACMKRALLLHSFAIIQPCNVDRFNGAEFVCCPSDVPAVDNSETESRDTNDVTKSQPIDPLPTPESSTPVVAAVSEHKAEDAAAVAGPTSDDDAYANYMQKGGEDINRTEHEIYRLARTDLEKRHHLKVTRMMKEWTVARQRVQEMRLFDEKGAEKLNRQITARFQKMYESLEKEGLEEDKQLGSVHQQRVQLELNEQKRHAMESYVAALNEEQPSAVKVLKALKHYIKTEQKDRVHTITHYQHVQRSNPVEAEAIFAYVADHLRVIDQRLTRALDMLHRLPKQEKKIRQHVDEFLSSYHSLDDSLAVILAKMAEHSSSVSMDTTGFIATTPTTDLNAHSEIKKTNVEIPFIQRLNEVNKLGQVDDERTTTTVKNAPDTPTSSGTPAGTTPARLSGFKFDSSFEHIDSGLLGGNDDYSRIHSIDHIGHMSNSELSQNSVGEIKKSSLGGRKDTGMYLATPLGIVACSVILIAIIAVGIAVLHKRSVRTPPKVVPAPNGGQTQERVPLGPQSMPQMNGYENPTHKFFEQEEMAA